MKKMITLILLQELPLDFVSSSKNKDVVKNQICKRYGKKHEGTFYVNYVMQLSNGKHLYDIIKLKKA